MHIRIIVKREKIEACSGLMHKLTHLSKSITFIDNFLIITPLGKYNEITGILENLLICYGIESEIELPSHVKQIEKEKGS